ncbi:MAG: ABC transporter permease [Spirochaetes bacterium]|jgi:ABC-2 type transport system permease protein|nr:ABC transporter permease [Spirochaetota bacterium]
MSGYAHHFTFDFKAGVRDTTNMLMNYLFPVGFFIMIGLFMPSINPAFLEIMIPGLIVFAIMSGTLMTIPATLIDQRTAGILRSYRVNGVPSAAVITIPVVSALVHMLLVSVLLTVAGSLLFGATLPQNCGWFVLVIVLATLALATLSALIGVVAPSSRAGTLLAQLVFVPSVLLGGLMVPPELLPAEIARGASVLPATQAMRGFSSLAMEGGAAGFADAAPLVVLAVSIVLNLILCRALFEWNARASGARRFMALLALVPFLVSVAVW